MTGLYGFVKETRNPQRAMHALVRDHAETPAPAGPAPADTDPTGLLIAWDPADLAGALDRLVAAHPERFSGPDALPSRPVPFHMRVLDAEVPPPIMLHPQMDHALAGYVREQARGVPLTAGNRHYKDRYAKFEVAVAITDLCVLSGQRSMEELRIIADGLDLPWLHAVLSFRHESPVHAILRMSSEEAARALRETTGAVVSAPEDEPLIADAAAVVRRLDYLFPGDRGLLMALCLNHIHLAPGQAMVTPAGCLHTYLSGQAMVVTSISENSLKAGLTKDYVDSYELQQILQADQPAPAPLPVVRTSDTEERIPLWSGDLGLRRVVAGEADTPVALDRFSVLLSAHGDARVTVDGVSADIEPGASILYLGDPATAVVSGGAQLFIASRR